MPGNMFWSKGFNNEYGRLESVWNSVDRHAKLQTFIQLIEQGERLMDAHNKAFFPDQVSPLSAVDKNWFGAKPMWFLDCTLTTGQIHEVMRWSRVRTVQLLLAGGWDVHFWLQCGHPRFRTVITWPGAERDEPPCGGRKWRPTPFAGPVRVWVYTPFNSSYGDPSKLTDQKMKKARERREQLLRRASEFRAKLEKAKTGEDPPRISDFISRKGLDELLDNLPADERIFQGTPLAISGDDTGFGKPDGLSVKPLEGFEEPPRNPREKEPNMYSLPGPQFDPTEANGIEISWNGAGDGDFPFDPDEDDDD